MAIESHILFPLHASGHPSFREALNLRWVTVGRYAFGMLLLITTGMIVIAVVAVWRHEGDPGIAIWRMAEFFPAALAIWLLMCVVVPRSRMRSEFKNRSGLFQPREVTIDDQVITLKSENAAAVVDWNAFEKYIQANDVILILGKKVGAILLSRSMFTDEEQWAEYVGIVATRLKPANTLRLLIGGQ